jgi:hypothetical protein
MRTHAALEGNGKAEQEGQKDTHLFILPNIIFGGRRWPARGGIE